MSLDAALATFHVEAQEHLESMENNLLAIDEGESSDELLNDIFRSAHTIKGSAGIFGLDHIVDFTHLVENVLDRARDKEIVIEDELLNILFKCRDHIQVLVTLSFDDFQLENALKQSGDELLKSLAPWGDVQSATDNDDDDTADLSTNQTNSDSDNNKCWHISLRLDSDCLKNGMDPLSFIKFLSTLGEIKHIETLTDNFPELDNFDPEASYSTNNFGQGVLYYALPTTRSLGVSLNVNF